METGLTSKAMLTTLSISQWSARKFDKKITDEVAKRHGTAENVGRYNKNLLPDQAEVYKAISAAAGAARSAFYEETLPWLDNGTRILTAANFIAFGRRMREKQTAFEAAIQPFVDQYPFLKARAKAQLNGLYREEDYPEKSELKEMFSFELKFFPIPDERDFRCEVHEEAVQAIKEQIQLDVKCSVAKAMEEPYRRLFDGVAHMAARLSGAKTCLCRKCKGKEFQTDQFADSLVDNLVELCDTLPRLNLTGDEYLEQYIEQVKVSLTGFHPNSIRASETLKQTLAERATALQTELAGWMAGG